MTIMIAIEFWYEEVKELHGTGNRYLDWLLGIVERGSWDTDCAVVLGFFCLEDRRPFD